MTPAISTAPVDLVTEDANALTEEQATALVAGAVAQIVRPEARPKDPAAGPEGPALHRSTWVERASTTSPLASRSVSR